MLNNLLDQLRNELEQTKDDNESANWADLNAENYFVSPFRPHRMQILLELIAHLESYQQMMAEDENIQHRRLSNEWVLKTDPVYSSPLANRQLRAAISTRRLPCEQAVFETAYKQILEPKPCGTAIVQQDAYELVPQKIPALMILESGLKESYLLKKCQEHGITLRTLEDLLFLRKEYKTGLYKLLDLNSQGFSMTNIELFMTVRELTDFSVSINKIIELWKCFGEPEDPGCLANAIMQIAAEYEIYPSQAVKRLIKAAYDYQQFEVEGILDLLLIDLPAALNDE